MFGFGLCDDGGSVVMVCGIISIAGGATAAFAGCLIISHAVQDQGSWIVNNLFGGDIDLVKKIGNIALTIAAVAGIVGGSIQRFACFVEDTTVITENGLKNIQDIQVGDRVLSYNEQTGEQSYQLVTKTFEKQVDSLIEIRYNNSSILTTPEHPFYINGAWVPAQNIKSGDALTTANGEVAVVDSVAIISTEATVVYNFEVENNHTYYVDGGILVHNVCVGGFDKNSKLGDFVVKEIADDNAHIVAQEAAKQTAQTTKALNKWPSVKKAYWRTWAENYSGDKLNITNFKDVATKGVAPRINGGKPLQLHHVLGKSQNMWNVVPMTSSNHTAFHRIFGYKWWAPKFPWPTSLT